MGQETHGSKGSGSGGSLLLLALLLLVVERVVSQAGNGHKAHQLREARQRWRKLKNKRTETESGASAPLSFSLPVVQASSTSADVS